MQDKTKNILVTVGFVVILFVVFLINLITKDKQVSTIERRRLAQFPEVTIQKLTNGEFRENFEKYTVDQFVSRDIFRNIKSFSSINIFRAKDNNNLFEKDGAIYKMEYPLNRENVKKSVEKINDIYEKYLQGMNVYYAIIPDKNYYLQDDDHLNIQYDEVVDIVKDKLDKITYIDIKNSLSLSDYYKTDLHWKQENLIKVVNAIENSMRLKITSKEQYKIEDQGEFYGTYYGQLGVDVLPDRLYTLTNDIIEKCTTFNVETNKIGKVYDKIISQDRYDIYLSGATPIINIENPNSSTKKELLLFRDSFGSSIAPLLIENYSKITLIDVRYVSSQILGNYIDFENQDVLFLYNTLILNQNVLK